MPNALCKSGRTAFATGNIKWRTRYGDAIRCVLVSRSYDPNLRSDSNITDIPVRSRFGVDGQHSKEYFPKLIVMHPDDAIFDANDVVIDGVPSGKEIKGVVIFKDAPNDEDTILIAYIRVDFITNGTQIVIGWDDGPSKIFRL